MPARLAFLRNALSTAARRTSSTPSPCLLALRKNAAPLRRVACRDFPRAAPPNVILARAPQRIKEARNVRAKRGRAGKAAWSGRWKVQGTQFPAGVGEIAATSTPARLAFLRNALSTAARRTSSTPSPCLLALRKNAAPLRRVACRDFPRAAPPNVILARAPQRIKEARNVRAKRGRAGKAAWSGRWKVQGTQFPAGVIGAEPLT